MDCMQWYFSPSAQRECWASSFAIVRIAGDCCRFFMAPLMLAVGLCSKMYSIAAMLVAGVMLACLHHCLHHSHWMPALVHGNKLQQGYSGTAAQLLQTYPDSPYTSFLITSSNHTDALDQHYSRLAGGMSALSKAAASSHGISRAISATSQVRRLHAYRSSR